VRLKPVVAIDGPSGVGKSTVAKGLAAQIGFSYIDTGALYRAAALLADAAEVDWQDGKGVAGLLASRKFAFEPEGTLSMDGRPLGDLIRTPNISRGSSQVARHIEVRKVLVKIQRSLGRGGGVVLDGRDIGTVVFPDAEIKFFLTASACVRARRRFLELKSKGENTSLEEVGREQAMRDETDRTRAVSPLKRAKDAIEINTDNIEAQEVIREMMEIVKTKFPLTFGQKT
jgi:cytidylate kinase